MSRSFSTLDFDTKLWTPWFPKGNESGTEQFHIKNEHAVKNMTEKWGKCGFFVVLALLPKLERVVPLHCTDCVVDCLPLHWPDLVKNILAFLPDLTASCPKVTR